jgi:hypothetical protein
MTGVGYAAKKALRRATVNRALKFIEIVVTAIPLAQHHIDQKRERVGEHGNKVKKEQNAICGQVLMGTNITSNIVMIICVIPLCPLSLKRGSCRILAIFTQSKF